MSTQTFSPDVLTQSFPCMQGFRHLQSGAYKSVYHVSYADGRADEVLKVICLPALQDTEEQKALYAQEYGRVQRETTILAACRSPFVVHLGTLNAGAIVVGGQPCYAYSEELLPGTDLQTAVVHAAGSYPSETEVRSLLRCLVSAIETLWRDHRVVHRDIKPGNIFTTGNPVRPYVLIDLGIAYDVTVPGLTLRKDHMPATPLYMAPEMLKGDFRENISYRSDLYAAGLAAFEFATGRHPLASTSDDLRRTLTRVLYQEPAPLASLRPDLSPSFCMLVDQLLKKNPALRPANLKLILNQLS